MNVQSIDHVNIRIPDSGVERALEFYRDRLGFTPEKLELFQDGERTSFAFRMGPEALLHVRPVEDFEEPDGKNFDHFCVITPDFEEVKEELADEIKREGNPWGATGRAPAIYVEDPFGYRIEIKKE